MVVFRQKVKISLGYISSLIIRCKKTCRQGGTSRGEKLAHSLDVLETATTSPSLNEGAFWVGHGPDDRTDHSSLAQDDVFEAIARHERQELVLRHWGDK